MTTDIKPLAKFSCCLKSNTGLSSSGSQDNITPEMYGAIMGVLADPGFPQGEIDRLQAQVEELAGIVERYVAHDRAFDEELCTALCTSHLHPSAVHSLTKVGRHA